MRTTVRLDEELMTQVKEHAVRHGRTVTSVLEDSLRQMLERERRQPPTGRVDIVVFSGSGLLPGIDLDDRGTWGALNDAEDIEHFQVVTDADA